MGRLLAREAGPIKRCTARAVAGTGRVILAEEGPDAPIEAASGWPQAVFAAVRRARLRRVRPCAGGDDEPSTLVSAETCRTRAHGVKGTERAADCFFNRVVGHFCPQRCPYCFRA